MADGSNNSGKDGASKFFAIDPSHSYYLHHSEQPRHLIVPVKLNGPNYPLWSKSMIHVLTAKRKISFIDSSFKMLPQTSTDFEL